MSTTLHNASPPKICLNIGKNNILQPVCNKMYEIKSMKLLKNEIHIHRFEF